MSAPVIWSLRDLSQADLEWSLALHCESLGPYVYATWGRDESDERRRFADAFAEALKHRRVIEIHGVPVGVLTVHARATELELELLEITPAWQGRGLGGAIVAQLRARADTLGVPLTLRVLRANPRARALYERHGLIVVDDSDPIRVWMSTAAPSQA